MHYITATVDGERRVLVETAFCDSAFDYYCLYLRDYKDNFLTIEGDCEDDPNKGDY